MQRALAELRNPGVRMMDGGEGSEKPGVCRSFGKRGNSQQAQPGGEARQGRGSLRPVSSQRGWG